jgi:hypothetical protein
MILKQFFFTQSPEIPLPLPPRAADVGQQEVAAIDDGCVAS